MLCRHIIYKSKQASKQQNKMMRRSGQQGAAVLPAIMRMMNIIILLMLILLALACWSAAAQQEETDITHTTNTTATAETTTTTTNEDGTTATEEVTAENGHSTEEGTAEEDEEHVEPVYAVLMPWFVQAVGVVIYFLLTRIKYLHGLPYTCVLFITGIFMGSGAVRTGFQDQLTESIGLWRGMDHEVLFLVFLPGLLFKDALDINFHLWQAALPQLLLLAFPMVLMGCMVTALVGYYIFPFDWSWQQCFTFGAILAATDPVAVAALLNEVGGPPRLKIHIAGESLLNDGSAVVFYTVFSSLFLAELGIGLGEDIDVGQAFKLFFRMSLGGCAVGIAFSMALIYILFRLDRRFEHEEGVLQVAATVTTAYLAFYTAEVAGHMSGVIAVVTCGVLTKAFGGSLINDWLIMGAFWALLEHLLNTVLFALAGIEFGFIIADTEGPWTRQEWGYLIVLFIFLNIIRFGLMFLYYPIISRIGIKSNVNEAIFSSWAGLRGAVGIALALGLDNQVRAATEDPEKLVLTGRLFGMVSGVAFLTLVINGSLSGPLLLKLGLAESTESRKRIINCAEDAIKRHLLDDFIHLMIDSRFYFLDFGLVQFHVPLLRNLTVDELATAVKENKAAVHPAIYKVPNLENVFPYIENSEPLQRMIAKTKRDMFLDASHDLEIVDENDARSVASRESSVDLLTDTRLMFIELLRAAYTGQISDGELDPREYDGFLSYSLLQSLSFAHDEAVEGKPLNDWNLAQVVSNEYIDKIEVLFSRAYYFMCRETHQPENRPFTLKEMQPLQYQRLRLTVLRSFSFMDAHREAQDRLRDEFGGAKGEMSVAFQMVLQESEEQVRRAEEILRSKTKKQLKDVISHHLCIILHNKTARYINLLLEGGVLLPKEAREYLEEIEHEVRHIRTCPLDRHPGTIEVVLTQEDTEGVPRRRRKVRQKSVL